MTVNALACVGMSNPAVLIGHRIRELRTSNGVTTAQVAEAAGAQGLPWSDSRVSALERGKVALAPGVLYVVAGVLSSLLGRDVTVADLVPEDVPMRLTPDLVVSGEQLADAFRGSPVRLPSRDTDLDALVRAALVVDRARAADPRTAWTGAEEMELFDANELLGGHVDALSRADLVVLDAVTPNDHIAGLVAALRLWGATPLVERDRRAPDGANAQKLGRITRELIAELAEAIQGGSA